MTLTTLKKNRSADLKDPNDFKDLKPPAHETSLPTLKAAILAAATLKRQASSLPRDLKDLNLPARDTLSRT